MAFGAAAAFWGGRGVIMSMGDGCLLWGTRVEGVVGWCVGWDGGYVCLFRWRSVGGAYSLAGFLLTLDCLRRGCRGGIRWQVLGVVEVDSCRRVSRRGRVVAGATFGFCWQLWWGSELCIAGMGEQG